MGVSKAKAIMRVKRGRGEGSVGEEFKPKAYP